MRVPYFSWQTIETRRLSWLVAVSAGIFLGCAREDEPISSLSSSRLSSTFTAQYWNAEAQQETETWDAALLFCEDPAHGLLPNCEIVRRIAFVGTLQEAAKRRSRSYDGTRGVNFPASIEQQLSGTPTPRKDDPESENGTPSPEGSKEVHHAG